MTPSPPTRRPVRSLLHDLALLAVAAAVALIVLDREPSGGPPQPPRRQAFAGQGSGDAETSPVEPVSRPLEAPILPPMEAVEAIADVLAGAASAVTDDVAPAGDGGGDDAVHVEHVEHQVLAPGGNAEAPHDAAAPTAPADFYAHTHYGDRYPVEYFPEPGAAEERPDFYVHFYYGDDYSRLSYWPDATDLAGEDEGPPASTRTYRTGIAERRSRPSLTRSTRRRAVTYICEEYED